jgi:hypothetical protein
LMSLLMFTLSLARREKKVKDSRAVYIDSKNCHPSVALTSGAKAHQLSGVYVGAKAPTP